MAYKFQLGAAVLSGSLTQEGNVTADSSTISGSSLTLPNGGLSINGTAVNATAAELNLIDGGTARGTTAIATGDGFLHNDGGTMRMTQIDKIAESFAGNGLQAAGVGMSIKVDTGAGGGNSFSLATDGISLNSNLAGDGLGLSSGVLSVDAAQTEITSVKNASLQIGAASGNDFIDFGTGGSIIAKTDDTARLTVADATTTVSNDLVVAGNLTVQGSSVEIQQGFVVTSSVQFEGTVPDGNELTLTTANPTADRTVTIPDLTGHVPLLAGAIGNANVTAEEFLLLDGGSTVQTATVADGDAVLFNDAGTMKHINVTSLKTYFQSGVTADTANGFVYNTYNTASAAQDLNGTAGFYGVNSEDGTSSNAVTLDLSGSWTNGNVVIIKAPNNAATNNVTVRASGSGDDADTIDGESSILLESDNAAVTLVYAGGNWSIV
tara:strand:- start:1670 stop:2977 length:1308 start_codon:yes stop_codon:yes gene_type:complete